VIRTDCSTIRNAGAALSPRGTDRIRYFCSPHLQDSALYPFIGQLERAAGFARDDTATTKLDKLEALLGEGEEPGDLSLIAEMLSLSPALRVNSRCLEFLRSWISIGTPPPRN
jgi:hypothetical protein